MRPSINELRALTDFCPNYRWDMNASLPANVAQAIQSTDLNLRCTSFTIPKRTVDPIEIANRGHKIYREGITSFSQQIALSTLGTIDAYIHKAVRNWHMMQWSDDGQTVNGRMSSNNPGDRQGMFTLTALNNTDQSYWQYLVYGVWLQDSDFGEYGSDSSDILRPSLTFNYDFFIDGPVTGTESNITA